MNKSRTDTFATVVVMAAVMVATGCNKADKYLHVEPAVVELNADETVSGLTVEASTPNWMAWLPDMGEDEWLTFRYTEDDPGVLWLDVADINESLEVRYIELTIIAGDGQSVTVPVSQLAAPVSLTVTPPTLQPFDGQGLMTQTLAVETNREWSFFLTNSETGNSWVTVTRGQGNEENILTVGTKPSLYLNERRDTLVVKHLNENFASLADSIPVVQKGVELLVTTELMDLETFYINLPAAGGEIPVYVTATAPWTVTVKETSTGVTLDLAGGDAGDGMPLYVNVPGNTATESFEFTLVFVCGGETYEYKFVQAGIPAPEP